MKQLFAYNVATGGMTTLDVTETPNANPIEAALAQLHASGFDGGNASHLIITENAIPDWQPKVEKAPIAAAARVSGSDLPTPPIPKPASPTVLPPQKSNELVVSCNPVSGLYVQLNGQGYIPANQPALSPPFPTSVNLQFSTYWEQVGIAIVTGQQVYTKSIGFTQGMSDTNSQTLSAEFGVSYGALSAKVTATIEHSITISSETSVTDTYEITVPSGTTSVYVLWQLKEKFLFVDGAGQPISYSGKLNIGPFLIPASFPNDPRFNQSNTVYSDRTDFPSP